MHFSALIIHEDDIYSLMKKYNYEATESSGAKIEFEVEKTQKEMQEEYEEYLKDFPDTTFEEFVEGEYSYLVKNENGDFGNKNNVLGMYDWWQVGGRWNKALPPDKNEKQLKKLVEQSLKNFQEKNDVINFVKIAEMPIKEACAFLSLTGQDAILIGEFSFEEVLEWWEAYIQSWEKDKPKDVVPSLFSKIIIETNEDDLFIGGSDKEMSSEFLKEKYEYYKKINLEKGNDRSIFMTVVDCHC